jgi:alpha-glucosidase (family GH31 glycosyl hydrolase)
MYDETTPIVRDIIKRRYELIPYLYSLALGSHTTATPPQRWTGWGFEQDPEVWQSKLLTDGETQYWLGDALLVGGVFEAKQETAKVYLPKDPANPDLQFLNVNATQKFYEAGQWVEIPAKWQEEGIPVLARVGGAIPVGKSVQVRSPGDKENFASLPEDDYRAIEIFPPKGSSHGKEFANRWYEDDGVSPPPVRISVFEVKYTSEEDKVYVSFGEQLQERFDPAWKQLDIILPNGDKRAVVFNEKEARSVKVDDKGRRHFRGESVRKV